MTQQIDMLTARRVVFSVCLSISSAVALPTWGAPISSYECTDAQMRSPEAGKCVALLNQDDINNSHKYHVLLCKGSGLTCCLKDDDKPNKPISDCKYLGDVPPVTAPPPSCKSIDENYHKAVQALTETQRALTNTTSKEQKIKATKDQKLIDAWKAEVKAETNDHDKAVKEEEKIRSAWDNCNKDLFKGRK